MTPTRAFSSLAIALPAAFLFTSALKAADAPFPGPRGEKLDLACREDIWDKQSRGYLNEFVKVPRDQVVAFALYTHDHGVLKMSAQLFPLQSGETREVRLELQQDGQWREVAKAPVQYPGWSANFRLEDWDNTRSVPYRVRHGEKAMFEGLIRKDPIDKDVIVVGSLSCDSNADRGDRAEIVENLKRQDPDLLFFAGDQSYDHKEHTAGWLVWGSHFRDIIRDRPVVTIPDDHDIGQGNVWGESGIEADGTDGASGGYYYPAEYINMVQRCQTWHLPDCPDPKPVARGITVYFTNLRVGGVDFAILEDRKFKSGPKGKIPQMGPRPDHIREPGYDPKKIDLPPLKLLGDRQLAFLDSWGQDWTGSAMKAVLSQTAFCGAVHLHGSMENRLLADLDCDGWPQTGRNKALAAIRRAMACHLCGDQHLTVVVKHGIDQFGDGPYAFTNPAIVNSYYGRWWWPEDEKAGPNPVPGSPLPWTGDFLDGLYNKISMIAYANPDYATGKQLKEHQRDPEAMLGDGYGLVRFDKRTRKTTFECWPRYADLAKGDAAQYPGWPITFQMEENDGRKVAGYLPELRVSGAKHPVVQVIREADAEILYTLRIQGDRYRPRVYGPGKYTVKVGRDKPGDWSAKGLAVDGSGAKTLEVTLP